MGHRARGWRGAKRVAIALGGLTLLGGGLLTACSSSSTTSAAAHQSASQAMLGGGKLVSPTVGVSSPHLSGDNLLGEDVTPSQPLIIRTGDVSLQIGRTHMVSVFDDITVATSALGGYVSSSSTSAAGDEGGASLVLRVPGNEFSTLVSKVDSLGKVISQSENGRDVTGESIDIEAQLANLESEEVALRNLMSHAGSISSILTVQDQLFSVEGDIEELSAQESSLVNRVAYATLAVDLIPTAVAAVKAKPKQQNTVLRSLKLAGHNSAVALRSVALAIGWAFPLLVLALIGLAVFGLRRRTSKKPDTEPTAPTAA